MEEITTNLYTDYAHTPEKIKAAINVAIEMTKITSQKLVVVYEPLTNRRQLFIKDKYKDVFMGVDNLYWVPSYLARENPLDKILTPDELIEYLENKHIAMSADFNSLKGIIDQHLSNKDFILCMSGGGAGSLDEWLRENY
jgi:UDP-N-acetylmuramate--alanine ligase